ncbi:Mur ligase family protein [Methanobacterium formicicum]|uniref:Mur ligase middle domain-containing protein n=1 Tax=Methanobacterium formicicum (strain DSM 3637 / PP1) TaxID=1204725 RepID=K2R9Z9_METFP|nr:Mur ligase family protein [Methanobacterium formicicum]EKF85154.1 Mur ligase middle domain-containing protein [Methanobacterium formicicum DSM 3637]
MKQLTTSYLAKKCQGELIGNNQVIIGIFNILKDAGNGDAIIRHWIDETGVQIASDKGASCVITQDARGNAIETAKKLNFPIILTEKIELINAFALRWALDTYAPDTLRIVVSGTNGKSTTTHMIHSILVEAGYTAHTNTDSESEFNTLIDPMVAKQIAEFDGNLDAVVLEVSEVQGWDDRNMDDHAHLMTSAIQPQVVVLTNVALDHISLVNSLEEASKEISGTLKGFKGNYVVLNCDDPLIRNMQSLVSPEKKVIFYGSGSNVEFHEEGIFHKGKLLIPLEDLPFKSPHFIQNTLAAVSTVLALEINPEIIIKAVKSYNPLKRRFTVLGTEPLIIDDFAHNPQGIKATINSAADLTSGNLHVVCAIRGSRGNSLNKLNAQAVADSVKNLNCNLILTSSQDVVDSANWVKTSEKKVFIDVLQKEGINYIHYETLVDALKKALKSSHKRDSILLIGAQGMDPASYVLKSITVE